MHDLVETSKCHEATVLRKNNVLENIPIKIDPDELVPGDLLVLPAANYVMPCDAVLLTGQCIINESVLTGKISLMSLIYIFFNFNIFAYSYTGCFLIELKICKDMF